jgi:hypothetical protein
MAPLARLNAARVEHLDAAQAVATGAGAGGVVEAEEPRFHLGEAVMADRAGVVARKRVFLVGVHVQRDGAAVGQAQCGFEAFAEPLLDFGPNAQAVHHHVNIVLLGLFQRAGFLDGGHLPVDAQAHEALRLQRGEFVLEGPFAPAGDGRQNRHPAFRRPGQHAVDHLCHALCLQGQAMLGAIGSTDPRVQ